VLSARYYDIVVNLEVLNLKSIFNGALGKIKYGDILIQ